MLQRPLGLRLVLGALLALGLVLPGGDSLACYTCSPASGGSWTCPWAGFSYGTDWCHIQTDATITICSPGGGCSDIGPGAIDGGTNAYCDIHDDPVGCRRRGPFEQIGSLRPVVYGETQVCTAGPRPGAGVKSESVLSRSAPPSVRL